MSFMRWSEPLLDANPVNVTGTTTHHHHHHPPSDLTGNNGSTINGNVGGGAGGGGVGGVGPVAAGGGGAVNNDGGGGNNGNNGHHPSPPTSQAAAAATPTIKNHSVTHHDGYLYCFGGYDGRRNHMTLMIYNIASRTWNTARAVAGTPPPGRNGHTATLACANGSQTNRTTSLLNYSGNNGGGGGGSTVAITTTGEEKIIIIGGWLGSGPLAASDTHVLDVSNGPDNLRWFQPMLHGTPPGPCNMHSADYVPSQHEVYVFRGGNGREYLNDLHALHVGTYTWRRILSCGDIPQQRANHSSAVLEETNELFIFGGWNGRERLNDIHILDITTSTWTAPKVGGELPHPRAGMTLTALRDRLYLFGGSGTSSKCFCDLQILDRNTMCWLDVYPDEEEEIMGIMGVGVDHHHHDHHHHGMMGGHHRIHDVGMIGGGGGGSSSGHHHQFGRRGLLSGGGGGSGRLLSRSRGGSDPWDKLYHRGGSGYGGAGVHDLHHHHQPLHTEEGLPIPVVHSSSSSRTLPRGGIDWRTKELSAAGVGGHSSGGGHHHLLPYHSANPNDEDSTHTITILGHGPGRRAGHTATAVNRFIYVFGGSCGSDYLSDFYLLDTDPPPVARVDEPNTLQLLERRLCHFFNEEEFADVVFIVEGRRVYGHRMVLSLVSDCFRAMFTTGFRESCRVGVSGGRNTTTNTAATTNNSSSSGTISGSGGGGGGNGDSSAMDGSTGDNNGAGAGAAAAADIMSEEEDASTAVEIDIPNCSYQSFVTMMEYIYTGCLPRFNVDLDSIMEAQAQAAQQQQQQQQDGTVNDFGIVGVVGPSSSAASSASNQQQQPFHSGASASAAASSLSHHQTNGISRAVELLELADQFFLDHLKQVCERMLQPAVRIETYETLLMVAQKTNANQLEKSCRHFARNQMNSSHHQFHYNNTNNIGMDNNVDHHMMGGGGGGDGGDGSSTVGGGGGIGGDGVGVAGVVDINDPYYSMDTMYVDAEEARGMAAIPGSSADIDDDDDEEEEESNGIDELDEEEDDNDADADADGGDDDEDVTAEAAASLQEDSGLVRDDDDDDEEDEEVDHSSIDEGGDDRRNDQMQEG